MESEAFLVNPIGNDYDIDDVIKRFKAGESQESLFKKPFGPRPNAVPAVPGLIK